MEKKQGVEFEFEMRQVKTMADRSVNVTLNLPEYCAEQAAQLIRRIGEAGRAVIVFEQE